MSSTDGYRSSWHRHSREACLPLRAINEVLHLTALAFKDDLVIQAGARLQIERSYINAELPPPFTAFEAMIEDLFTQADEEGALQCRLSPAGYARVLVAAFFGAQHISWVQCNRTDIVDRVREIIEVVIPTEADQSLAGRQLVRPPGATVAIAVVDSPAAALPVLRQPGKFASGRRGSQDGVEPVENARPFVDRGAVPFGGQPQDRKRRRTAPRTVSKPRTPSVPVQAIANAEAVRVPLGLFRGFQCRRRDSCFRRLPRQAPKSERAGKRVGLHAGDDHHTPTPSSRRESHPGPHGTVRKPLVLHGSCRPDHQASTALCVGARRQCANMRRYRFAISRNLARAFFLPASRLCSSGSSAPGRR